MDLEGWKRLKKEQVQDKGHLATIEEVEAGLGNIEDDLRRQASKRGAEEKIEKKTKKRKFPRLEGWGEGVIEPEDVSVPPGGRRLDTTLVDTVHEIEPYKMKNSAKQDIQAAVDRDHIGRLIDKETELIMKRSKKLQDKKEAISKEVKKKKFVFNTRGKLKKKEVEELKRTHTYNIFSWVKADKQKLAEMDNFEEVASRVDKELLKEVLETDLDRENRLQRVKNRQQEFWTRKMARDMLEDVLDGVRQYRATELSRKLLEDLMSMP